MKYIYDFIIILLIVYLIFCKKTFKETMNNSTSCDENIKDEVIKLYKEDVKHIKNLTEIAAKLQSNEGLKMKENSIIEIEGDINVPSGVIEVVGENNYLENIISEDDKVSVYHNSTGYRLDQSGFRNRISYNQVIDPAFKNYIFTVKKPTNVDNSKFTNVENSSGEVKGNNSWGWGCTA